MDLAKKKVQDNDFIKMTNAARKLINYCACGQFTKSKEKIQKFKKPGDSQYINHTELDKDCFLHDMVYGDFKDLHRRNSYS